MNPQKLPIDRIIGTSIEALTRLERIVECMAVIGASEEVTGCLTKGIDQLKSRLRPLPGFKAINAVVLEHLSKQRPQHLEPIADDRSIALRITAETDNSASLLLTTDSKRSKFWFNWEPPFKEKISIKLKRASTC